MQSCQRRGEGGYHNQWAWPDRGYETSTNKALCDTYKVGERSPDTSCRHPMGWTQHEEGTLWVAECSLDGCKHVIFNFIHVNMFLFWTKMLLFIFFSFFCINLVITPDVTELFVCKHWWVKVKKNGELMCGAGGESIFTFNCPECLEWFYSLHQIAVCIYERYIFCLNLFLFLR